MSTKAARSRRMPRRTAPAARPADSRRLPLIVGGGLALVLVIAAIVALALGSSSGDGGVTQPAEAPVRITGEALPEFTDPASDPAIGQRIPELSGIGLDGQPLSIGPDDGPMAIVILAHWCPHCQNEVPGLVDYLESGALPEGTRVVGLTTSINAAQPNYPPSAWLEREGWTVPTLVDDASNSGLAALGIGSFPGFVFVDADGAVVQRMTGEIGAEAFGQIMEVIAP